MARILIVDDSMISRLSLKKLLISAGHEIVGECMNGLEGIKKYDETKPDLVTMDITMPEMDGLEALKRIIYEDPQARIIMISALGQENKILEALDSGALNYVTKPYEPENVITAINDVFCLIA